MSAADDAPDQGGDDHDGDCNDDDGASARAIPRQALRFAVVGVAQCTGAVAERARTRLVGSNERKMVDHTHFSGFEEGDGLGRHTYQFFYSCCVEMWLWGTR